MIAFSATSGGTPNLARAIRPSAPSTRWLTFSALLTDFTAQAQPNPPQRTIFFFAKRAMSCVARATAASSPPTIAVSCPEAAPAGPR